MAEQQIHLSIGGMSCAGCVAAVEKALQAVPGVEEATVSFAEHTALVSGAVDAETLVKAVVDAERRMSAREFAEGRAATRAFLLRPRIRTYSSPPLAHVNMSQRLTTSRRR